MRLSNYPWVVVNVDCRFCPRKGRYRLARLAAKFGPETDLEAVLEAVAFDCKWMQPGKKARKYEMRCGIRFTDLDHGGPPPDLPPSTGGATLRVVEGGQKDAAE